MKIKILSVAALVVSVACIVTIQGSNQEAQSCKTAKRGHVVPLGDFGPGNRQTYDRIIKENDKVIFKFSINHCQPCKNIAPLYHAQAQLHQDMLFVDVNADMYNALVSALGVKSFPTFIMYKDHKQCARWVGGSSEQLRSQITSICA